MTNKILTTPESAFANLKLSIQSKLYGVGYEIENYLKD